jgi:acylglycerol lipase
MCIKDSYFGLSEPTLHPKTAHQPISASKDKDLHNYRGWGREVKKSSDKGNTGPTSQVLSDMHSFLLTLPSESTTPIFIMGHSMGGGQTLNYIFNPESPYNKDSKRPKLAGVMLYSPLIALDPASRPSKITVAAGRLAAKLLPHKQRYSPLDPKLLSRVESVVEDIVADKLCHDTGTLEGLAGMLDRGLWLEAMFETEASSGKWIDRSLPFWFGHGDGDRITSYPATKKFSEELKKREKDVTLVTYEGAYHRLHSELPETTTKFVTDIRDWILSKAGGVSASSEDAAEGNKAKL